ncbi:methionine--tRNA ligase [bacterium]|jgi:methionyl-tRNA synthetase|nr:methionine--tRNA ligase [bacterium]MBT4648765.1 methionine--tRNA ligase [bacterium]
MTEKKKYYITTPIYYVNDQPHIGHAYTTIVADVLARFYRQQGADVYFLTGTDEHGAKIAESAAKTGVEPQIFTDQVSQQFQDAWAKLEIEHDQFIRTTDDKHKEIVTEILNKLKTAKTPQGNDVLYEADYQGLYCVGCEKFITENELDNGLCPDHNKKPEQVTEKNWFFKLQDFLPTIIEKIKNNELIIYPESRKNEVLGLLEKQDLPDFSISRSAKAVSWGIDLPWDENQKAYVWVDALSNYITALDYPDGELFKKYWPADNQVMALDILKFHAIYWPAILLALGADLPKQLNIHGFFTIDGKKMSKTLGNVIHPDELVDKYGAEATKYLILSQFSFGSESDIKIEEFGVKYNADLVNGLGNLVNRITKMTEDYLGGKVKFNKAEKHFVSETQEKIEKLDFRGALLRTWIPIKNLNQAIDQQKPWELAKSDKPDDKIKLEDLLTEGTADLYNIAIALQPFMPKKSQEILTILTADKIVKPSTPLFERLK